MFPLYCVIPYKVSKQTKKKLVIMRETYIRYKELIQNKWII